MGCHVDPRVVGVSSLLPFGMCIGVVTSAGDSASLKERCTLLVCGKLLVLEEVSMSLKFVVRPDVTWDRIRFVENGSMDLGRHSVGHQNIVSLEEHTLQVTPGVRGGG